MGLPNCSRSVVYCGGELHRGVTRTRPHTRHSAASACSSSHRSASTPAGPVTRTSPGPTTTPDNSSSASICRLVASWRLARHARRSGVDDEEPDAVVGASRDDDGVGDHARGDERLGAVEPPPVALARGGGVRD